MRIELEETNRETEQGPMPSALIQGIVERAGKARAALASKLQVPATWPEITGAVSALCDEVERLRSASPSDTEELFKLREEVQALRKHLADVEHDFEESNKFCNENH